MKTTWRQREQEREKQRKEQELLKKFEKNDTNFPTLGSGAPVKSVATGVDFAKKAREWKEMDDQAKAEAELKRIQQEKEEAERKSVFVFRRKLQHSFDDQYYDERVPIRPAANTSEWQEVSGRVQIPKRPLSDEEYMRRMEQRYAQEMEQMPDEAEEFNPNQSYGTRDFY